MSSVIPLAHERGGRNWSGYFELSSTTNDNLRHGKDIIRTLWDNKYPLIAPTLLLLVFSTLLLKATPFDGLTKILLLTSCLLPLAIYLIGTDLWRWVALSMNMLILTTFVHSRDFPVSYGRALVLFAAASALFSPLGSTEIDIPFPIHDFVIKKLL